MSKPGAFLLSVFVAAGAWFASPMMSQDFAQVWFIGTGDWHTVSIMGRDILAVALGLLTWLGSLNLLRD